MTSTVILQAAGGSSMLSTLVPMVLIMVVFYFFMIRPQVKKAKDHKKLVADLKKGDEIVTTAGIHGRKAAQRSVLIKALFLWMLQKHLRSCLKLNLSICT
jgi:preprotein translocase YajC subunit